MEDGRTAPRKKLPPPASGRAPAQSAGPDEVYAESEIFRYDCPILLLGAFTHMKRFMILVCGIFQNIAASAASKYIGNYSIDIGGGDAMSAVHLHILPSGKYAVTYFGGMQTGVWQELPNGKLQLQQDHDPVYFYVYARQNSALKDSIKFNFDNCAEGSAKVAFAAKKGFSNTLRPVFSPDGRRYSEGNEVSLPASEVTALYLLENNEFKKKLHEAERPRTLDNLLYSFPVDKKYNDYKIILNKAASQQPSNYVGEFVDGNLLLYGTGPYPETINCREKRELREEERKELEEMMQVYGGRYGSQAQATEHANDGPVKVVYQRLKGTTQAVNLGAVTFIKPLFPAEAPADSR
ncbi:hypothetical protein [Hymenobacter weizhouensis]|uniref:hypothetical protein n=1 Tax=Hymenobacter sp. YIM 151500-1 TaxID=2987689 RepID=UPI002227C59B|nr:hypothetical protein [Hymenobacter sp. YIM 151500-1]UYZ63393.1 hypothetical protein OIS53_00775 [Hymenobacter sp. YIM 151500-1]